MSGEISRRKLIIGASAGAGTAIAAAAGYLVYQNNYGVSDYDGTEGSEEKPDMSHMDELDKKGKGDPDPQDLLDDSNIDVEKVSWPADNKKDIYKKASKLDDLNSIIPGTKDKK